MLTAQVDDAHLPPVAPLAARAAARARRSRGSSHAPAQLLAAAEQPVLFVGSQVWWDDAAEALRALVQRARHPGGDERDGPRLAARVQPARAQPGAQERLPRHRLHRSSSARRSTSASATAPASTRARQGHPDRSRPDAARPQPRGRRRPSSATRARSCGSSRQAALKAGALPPPLRRLVRQSCAPPRRRRAPSWQQCERADTRPINHYRLARAIADAIDDDTIVIGDGGDCVALAARVLAPERPGRWLDPGPLGCLGVGAPFALAAKKMLPGQEGAGHLGRRLVRSQRLRLRDLRPLQAAGHRASSPTTPPGGRSAARR